MFHLMGIFACFSGFSSTGEDEMVNMNMHGVQQLTKIHILRIVVLLIIIVALTAVAVVAFSDADYVRCYEDAVGINETDELADDDIDVIVTGTAGEGGAPWRMYPDGTIVVESGYINWPYYYIKGGPWDVNATHIIFTGPITAGPYLRFLFYRMTKLRSIEGLHYFDTSNVVDMSGMFSVARSLTCLDLSSWDTSNVVDMSGLFFAALNLENLDVSTWDTSSVINMNGVFHGAFSLDYLYVSDWDTSNVTDMSNMFARLGGSVSDLSGWNTKNVVDMSGMFFGSGVKSLNISSWDTRNVTNMNGMFRSASGITSLDLSGWDTSNVEDISYMFNFAYSLTHLDVSSWDTSNVTNMKSIFVGVNQLRDLDVSNWNTSNVTNMSGVFANNSIVNMDISGWNTGNVINMSSMFAASDIPVLDLSSWDTSNVVDMGGMFALAAVTCLSIADWDTSNVQNMGQMFFHVFNLTSLDLSSWNTSRVTSMSGMFYYARNLLSLNIKGWDVRNVINMHLMFANTKITNLDLTSWDIHNLLNMRGIFYISHYSQPNMSKISLGEYFVFVLNEDSDDVKQSIDAFHGDLSVFPYGHPHYNCIDLPQVPNNEYYTGHWQNVGPGTTYNPQGTHILTSDQLVATFDGATMADTWVWQPRRIGEGEESTSRITGNFTIPNPTRPVTIELVNNAAIGRSTSTAVISPPSSANTDIYFYFENLPPGTYSLVFSKPGHTSFTINNIVVTATEDTNLTTDPRFPGQLPLLPGNLTGDGQINITDLNILIQNWMGTCEDANLTGSGQVNIADLNLLLRNWMAESVVVD